ncbi:hypothetical protein RclHR1_01960031 [Rhizophagus clarus]|uniref:Uncharacterized protein n=1 Tax=Rhizophagus clarus TaxID=94130 RepID=A0A2Z6R533_9GLOM|nr:hypothetical protein RclHR1_01960031 [Rhizophagus clarus]GES78518.1 hypothetical protein GLOIN_2v1768213 [Rhizophagus clarus]
MASTNKLRLGKKVLESAKEQLIALQEREDTGVLVTEIDNEDDDNEEEEEEDKLESGIIVATNISLETYQNYYKEEAKLTVDMRLLDGNVIIYEVPLGPHAAVGGEFTRLMIMWYNNLMVFGDRNVIVSRNSLVRPDVTVQPNDLPQPVAGRECDSTGWPYPTVVMEVGLSEGVNSLHTLARSYFSVRTDIQIYLAIKIYSRRRNGTRAMVAFLYQRSNFDGRPILVKSFGTAPLRWNTLRFFRNMDVPNQAITGVGRTAPPCNGPNIPDYQINIPSNEIFRGSPVGIPPNLVVGFNLDLYRLQRAALRY